MNSLISQTILAALSLLSFLATPAASQQENVANESPYKPYDFLIDEWNVAPNEEEPAVVLQRLCDVTTSTPKDVGQRCRSDSYAW